jgi:hypothetical protein
VYERLKALAGPFAAERDEAGALPADAAQAMPAMALAAKPDAGVSEPAEGAGDAAAASEAAAGGEGDDDAPPLPTEWQAVKVGDLVLAPETDRMSWWPAIVLKAKGDSRWVLKWRDFDDPPSFVRHHSEIGLINPATTLR